MKTMLKERNIPPFKSSEEMLDILLKEEYGYMPQKPDSMSYEVAEDCILGKCVENAISKRVKISSRLGNKVFTFPCDVFVPKKAGKHPFFVCISFNDDKPEGYLPVKEIIENGFAVMSFCYEDVTSDDNDFTNGLSGILYENGQRGETDAGKIAMWAWAAQRVMDYAKTLDCLNMDCSIVCGHSRLGKTALLAAATDNRFKFAYSNESGCSGVAITREKVGEKVEDICRNFPYWFCENYKKYINNEDKMPFDQHYLVAAIAPRYVYVTSADEDKWADPVSEFLTCVAVSGIYEQCGEKGFVYENRLPMVGDVFHDGCVGYHLRAGKHSFTLEDWSKAMAFVKKHSDILV